MIILKQFTLNIPSTLNLPSTEIGFWINEDVSDVWNLKYISIPYTEPELEYKVKLTQINQFVLKYLNGTIFTLKVKSILKLNNHFYYKIENVVQIPVTLVSLDNELEDVELFFGDPGFKYKFNSDNYDVRYGNLNSNKNSFKFFTLEKNNNQLTPTNFNDILQNYSKDPNVDLLYRSLVQDTNYFTSAWNNLRYKGVKNTSQIEGKEPALSVYSFNGVIFPKNATTSSILEPPYDLTEDVKVYYNRNVAILNSDLLNNYRVTIEDDGEVNTLNCFGTDCSPDLGKTLRVTYYENDIATPVVKDTKVTYLMEVINFNSSVSYYETFLTIPEGEISGSYGYRTLFAGCGDECVYFQDNFVKLLSIEGPQEIVEGITELETIQRGNTFFYIDKDITKDLVNLTNVKVLSLKTKKIYTLDELGKVVEIE